MEIFGWIATVIVSIQFIPQLIRSIQTKDTEGLSLYMIYMIISGSVLWIIHGIIVSDAPILATNCVILVVSSSLLFIKLKYK